MAEPNEINRVIHTSKAYSVVPSGFASFADLGKTYTYNNFIFYNGTDQSVTFKLVNDVATEIEIGAGKELTLERFKHWGVLQYKYTDVQPTNGTVEHFSW